MMPEPAVGPVLFELVRVRPDAGERGLQVVADAAQEVVLGGVEFQQLGVLRLDLLEQLGVPDADRDLAGEQVQQVLVRALPAPRRRQPAKQDTELVRPDPQAAPAGCASRPARPPPPGPWTGRPGR